MPDKRRKKTGRPRKELDLSLVERLATIQCTDQEIAAALEVSPALITDRKKNAPEFLNAYTRGREQGKRSLRRLQWRAAEQGNIRMLEWLGKQYLGQQDKHAAELEIDMANFLAEVGTLLADFTREFVPPERWEEAIVAVRELDARISGGKPQQERERTDRVH